MSTRDTEGRRSRSPDAFSTISEVADELGVAQHVLRFWEGKFPQVKPLKRGGGRRYYRPADVDLLKQIRAWLYDDGFTIKGVQKLLREGAHKKLADLSPENEPTPIVAAVAQIASTDDASETTRPVDAAGASAGVAATYRNRLGAVLSELKSLRALLEKPL